MRTCPQTACARFHSGCGTVAMKNSCSAIHSRVNLPDHTHCAMSVRVSVWMCTPSSSKRPAHLCIRNDTDVPFPAEACSHQLWLHVLTAAVHKSARLAMLATRQPKSALNVDAIFKGRHTVDVCQAALQQSVRRAPEPIDAPTLQSNAMCQTPQQALKQKPAGPNTCRPERTIQSIRLPEAITGELMHTELTAHTRALTSAACSCR